MPGGVHHVRPGQAAAGLSTGDELRGTK
jgi:hypothetical protein